MKVLREVDLSQATAMMEKIGIMQQALNEEKKRLTGLLVNLNLEYYGSSPSEFYKSIHKEYCTEDEFSVKIDSGNITISKKITDNLTVTWIERFYEYTSFGLYHCSFTYDSGRHIEEYRQKSKFAEKHAEQFKRFEEILNNEQVYNPFTSFAKYISFTDFYSRERETKLMEDKQNASF